MRQIIGLLFAICVTTTPLLAGEVDVVKVDVQQESAGTYHFDVTLLHEDSGWKHYADRWEILTADGTVLATRVLLHPHVQEQPFTRSLSGVKISSAIDKVIVRGHDLVHGYGGKTFDVSLR